MHCLECPKRKNEWVHNHPKKLEYYVVRTPKVYKKMCLNWDLEWMAYPQPNPQTSGYNRFELGYTVKWLLTEKNRYHLPFWWITLYNFFEGTSINKKKLPSHTVSVDDFV